MTQTENFAEKVAFKGGLLPAIIQDTENKQVLMLAYMNAESLKLSIETGETHFWSRSRKKLWRKGETSGHVQKIKNIALDCDEDTLLIEVEQIEVACHTGARSCFYRERGVAGEIVPRDVNKSNECSSSPEHTLHELSKTIQSRKLASPDKSYTSGLLQGGIDRILKKVAEESGEVLIAAKNAEPKEIVHETADLLYHLLVVLAHFDIPFSAIEAELRGRSGRSGLAEKASRSQT